MHKLSKAEIEAIDAQHLWHPYQSMYGDYSPYVVESAHGTRLKLRDGPEVIDGMASWWCMIHGYNHPRLNQAIRDQLDKMAHVMFGGLTHEPAALLADKLISITPEALQNVFFCDSGSVAVEVAIKMAIQYWYSLGQSNKCRLLTIRHGYHGDTFGAMSVCDPVNGMHHLFSGVLPKHYFVDTPTCRDDKDWHQDQIEALSETLEQHQDEIAALVLEPIVQGAGGMRVYCPEFLRQAHALCKAHDVLLIADEIATGFGRTGKLFAVEHAGVTPDILCVGKAMTGGYLSMAATLTTEHIGKTISENDPGALMHGPTFMANPLAASVSHASIELLLSSPWQDKVSNIESSLLEGLTPYAEHPAVADIRVMGAIGVMEMKENLNVAQVQKALIEEGVWLRPFGKLLYSMPPYITSQPEVSEITSAMGKVLEKLY